MAGKIKLHHILFVGFTLISTVPVIILAVWVQQSALNTEIAAVREKHLLLAQNLTGALSRYARDVEAGFRFGLEHMDAGVNAPGHWELLRTLNFNHVRIVDVAGKIQLFIHISGARAEGAVPPELMARLRGDFAAARANPQRVVFTNVMADESGAPGLFLVKSMGEGRFGLAALATDYIAQVQRGIKFGEKGHAAIVDRAGRVLAHPREQWRLEMKDLSAIVPVARMMAGGTGVTEYFSPAVQADMIAGYTTVPGVGWGVMIPQPLEELVRHAGAVQRVALGIALLGIALAGLISWWLARYLAWPIRAVAESAEQVAAGKFNLRMPLLPKLAPVEMRQLFHSFNFMVDEVRDNTANLETVSERLADAQRIAHLGNWEWDIKNDKLWWSQETYNILGIDPEARVKKWEAFQEILHPEDRERVVDAIQNAFYMREPVELDHRVLLPGGSERIIFHKAEIHRDAAGEPERMSGTLLDITERRRMAALRESEQRFRNLVGQAADAFFLHDAQGTITDVNLWACESLGYSREELLALSLPELFGGEAPMPLGDLLGSVAPGNPATYLGEHLRKDGTRFPAEVRVGNIESGNQRMFLAVSRDITDRKRLEEQLLQSQKMEAIGTLAGGIAHDFNNLLFPIIGFTELTLEKLPPDSTEYADLKLVLGAAFRAKDIVSQVLLFSRKSEGAHQYFDLRPLVAESLKLLQTTLPNNVSIRQEIAPELPIVWGDSSQIHQIVINLYMNAVQAMEDGGELGLNLEMAELDDFETSLGNRLTGRFVRLSVSDTGKGMDEQTMARMFEPFFTTKAVGQGTGLGLSMVLGVVEQHEGGIRVVSQPGQGTTIQIFLKAGSESQLSGRELEAAKPVGTESILFVDDEAASAQVGKRILEHYGYDVTAVTSGKEALRIFEKDPQRFDLVITDQAMREMSGEELAGNLRRLRGDLPIIMCTGYSESITQDRMGELGIDGLFYKPVQPEEMGNLVREVLEQSKSGMAREA